MKALLGLAMVVLLPASSFGGPQGETPIRLRSIPDTLVILAKSKGEVGKDLEKAGKYDEALTAYEEAIETNRGNESSDSLGAHLVAASARIDAARVKSYLIDRGNYTDVGRMLARSIVDMYLSEAQTHLARAAELTGSTPARGPDVKSTIRFDSGYASLLQGNVPVARQQLQLVAPTAPQYRAARGILTKTDDKAVARRRKQDEALDKFMKDVLKEVIPHFNLLEDFANVVAAFGK